MRSQTLCSVLQTLIHLILLTIPQVLWLATSRMSPDDPHLLTSTSLYNSLPLSVGWIYRLHSKGQCGRSNGMSLARLGYKIIGFYLGCSSRHAASCPVGRPMWPRTEGDSQPKSSEELRPSVQQPARNSILPTTTRIDVEEGPPPVKPSDGTAALDDRLTTTS